ncbi:MAG: hypothetical protein WAM82_02290 [Thermoanaerobaculia bacterium]
MLQRFLSGEAASPEVRTVVRHLLAGCPQCVAVTRPAWGARGGTNGGHEVIEGARKEVRAVIEDLKAIRYRLWGVYGSIPPTAQETSRGDLEGDPDVETELRTVIANGVRNGLDPLIDDLETAVEYQPDPAATGSPSISHLDLSVFSEATRQGLYEAVAAENFRSAKLESGEDSVPQYTAAQAGLEVVWAWGRWFATWWKLELPDTLPEAERREILLLQENRRRPGTLAYGEV